MFCRQRVQPKEPKCGNRSSHHLLRVMNLMEVPQKWNDVADQVSRWIKSMTSATSCVMNLPLYRIGIEKIGKIVSRQRHRHVE